MITSFNFYYAHPGREGAVLRQRLHASDVRRKIGVARGRVLARAAGASTLPDVIWEHRFEDVASHHADMAVRAASAEFETVRAGMRALCRRFERPLFEIDAASASGPAAPMPGHVVTLDWIFCSAGKVSDAIAFVEDHAAQQGRDQAVLLRLITPGDDLPDIVWQHEYADVASYDSAQAQRARRADVATSPAIPDTLAGRVERSVWKVR